jgi:hypothetical protein
LLPSTDLLFKAMECLIDQAPSSGTPGLTGAAGTPGLNGATWYQGGGAPAAALGNNNDFYLNTAAGAGDGDVYQKQAGAWVKVGNIEGPAGTNGVGITAVDPTFVPCSTPGAASLTTNPTGLTLNLTIPGCCNTSLVTIKSVSWSKNGAVVNAAQLGDPGLGILFSGPVMADDLKVADPKAAISPIVLLIPRLEGQPQLVSWEELMPRDIKITPGNFAPGSTTADMSAFTPDPAASEVNGVRITVDPALTGELAALASAAQRPVRVLVKGDFIRDASTNHYAIDADHLPGWLPTRPTGDGIEGGTFESWIALTD